MSRYDQITNVLEASLSVVNSDSLFFQRAIAALAQEQSRSRVSAGKTADTLTALTDSSTGTPGTALAAVITPALFVMDGVTLVAPKAGFDTAIAAIRDAEQELLTRANKLIGYIAGSQYGTVRALVGATAANGTLEAITYTLTGSATAGVPAADGLTQLNAVRNNAASLASAVNFIRVALGMSTLPDSSGGVFDRAAANGWMTYDTAATGAAVTTGATSLVLADTNAALLSITNSLSTMAKYLNDAIAITSAGPLVIATTTARLIPSLADGVVG